MIKWLERQNKLNWLLTILIATFIFYISSKPIGGGGGPGWYWKPIIYHFTVFFFLSFFLLLALVKGRNKKLITISILISIIYAILDEIHQSFIPLRDASVYDVWVDAIGITSALILYTAILLLRKK